MKTRHMLTLARLGRNERRYRRRHQHDSNHRIGDLDGDHYTANGNPDGDGNRATVIPPMNPFSRILRLAAATCLAASAAHAGPFRLIELSALTPVSSNSGATATALVQDGWVEDIAIDMVSANSTSDVKVIRTNVAGNIAPETILHRINVTSDVMTRPTVAVADAEGTVNSNVMARFAVSEGDSLTFMVTNATVTNVTWRALIRIDLNR